MWQVLEGFLDSTWASVLSPLLRLFIGSLLCLWSTWHNKAPKNRRKKQKQNRNKKIIFESRLLKYVLNVCCTCTLQTKIIKLLLDNFIKSSDSALALLRVSKCLFADPTLKCSISKSKYPTLKCSRLTFNCLAVLRFIAP